MKSIPILGVASLGLAVVLSGCTRNSEIKGNVPVVKPPADRTVNVNVPKVSFTDITAKAGIRFHHVSGAFGKKLLPETMGSGCAFFDYDNDGHQDLLLVNSCYWPGFEEKGDAPTMALYRNRGDLTFEDVTEAAGLKTTFYGLGVAVGDYDNDGWTDVFITAVGGSRLYRNERGRRFTDVTKMAGDLASSGNWPAVKGDAFLKLETPISFSASAAFLDYDKDGRLDLFVCNYITWSPQYDLTQGFVFAGVGRAYGPPTTFPGTNCQLLRNRGDGTFEDVSAKAGVEVLSTLGRPAGKALGVIVSDMDEDGWPDVTVANDTVRNFLFHNQGDGSFKEKGQPCGVAYAEGAARGAMGIDWGEYRAGRIVNKKHEPGLCALVIGNFANEPDTFLRLENPKQLLFNDVALAEGIAGPSRLPLVFSVLFWDYDLDSRLDFISNNGHLEPEINRVEPNQHYKQPPQLFWNTGARPGFELALEDKVGSDLLKPLVGRGAAYADIDGNGTLDVVLMENGGEPRLFKNEGGTGNHWIRLALAGDGVKVNRSAIGARLIVTAGATVQKREIVATKGYLSCSELTATFGLGAATKVDRVEIHWPGKDVPPQVLTDLEVDRLHWIQMK